MGGGRAISSLLVVAVGNSGAAWSGLAGLEAEALGELLVEIDSVSILDIFLGR